MPHGLSTLDVDILRAANDGRLYIHTDCGERHVSFENVPEDRNDGSLCTDEAGELEYAGYLRRDRRRFVLTATGRAKLGRVTR